ncbi:pyocin knob domain-containing protein [Shouchella clausii]|uniref:pyocin knob domain-containing protein n=1 Tax=Shouchella clausii TaxID=79880 RepID=UPI0021757BEC|nr:pyocin knob domain-containing protein [Shouchella clausii]
MGDYREKTNWLPDDPITEDDLNRWEKGIKDAHTDINQHKADHNNPHRTTKSQVGLGNVDNVKQASKAEFDAHMNNKNNPHGTTKTHVGLGNVDNVKQASKAEFDAFVNRRDNPHKVTTEQVNVIGRLAVDAPSTAYPVGVSVFDITGSGWPTTHGTVMTVKINENRISQYYYDRADSVANTGIWFRSSHTANGWGEFHRLETTVGAQAKIDAHANNKNNPHSVTKAQVGLGNVQNYPIASQAQAEAGNHTASFMTPQRTKEAISALTSQATIISAIAGTVTGKDYPLGLTTFEHSNLTGYPTNHGTVLNIKLSNLRFTQWYFPHSIRHEEIGAYFRHFYDSDGWTSWQKVETTAESIRRVNQTGWGLERANDGPGLINDLDALNKSGQYWFTGAAKGSPWTGSAGGTLIHMTSGNNGTHAAQLAFAESNDRMLFRRKVAGSWTSWQQLETTSGAQEKVNATQVHKVTGDSGHGILLSSGTDLNKVFNAGFYRIQNPVNQPSDSNEGWAYLIVNKQAPTEALQIYIPFVSRVMYIRSSNQTGSWREWVRQVTHGELFAHTNDKGNPHSVTKAQVGLGNVQNYPIASQAQAEAGNHTASFMTPQRTKQAIDSFAVPLVHSSDPIITVGGRQSRLEYSNDNNSAPRLTGVTDLKTVWTNGQFYMTTVESSQMVDHPNPGVSGWWLDVTKGDSDNGVIQTLRRNVQSFTEVWSRVIRRNGATGDWVRRWEGDTGWIPLVLRNFAKPYRDREELRPRYRRIGDVVYLVGAVEGIQGPDHVIANIPQQFRPLGVSILASMPTSVSGGIGHIARWAIELNGDIVVQRTTRGDEGLYPTAWFPISTSWALGTYNA